MIQRHRLVPHLKQLLLQSTAKWNRQHRKWPEKSEKLSDRLGKALPQWMFIRGSWKRKRTERRNRTEPLKRKRKLQNPSRLKGKSFSDSYPISCLLIVGHVGERGKILPARKKTISQVARLLRVKVSRHQCQFILHLTKLDHMHIHPLFHWPIIQWMLSQCLNLTVNHLPNFNPIPILLIIVHAINVIITFFSTIANTINAHRADVYAVFYALKHKLFLIFTVIDVNIVLWT